MSKSNANVFKTYSNRSNARRAAATAKLAEGTFELNTLEGGKCELKEIKAAAPTPTKATKEPSASGYKIEAKREVRNGIKRHSAGTTCDNLWKLFESMAAELKNGIKDLTCAAAKEAASKKGYDMTTTTIQFYAWRRFSGVRGRVVLKKAM